MSYQLKVIKDQPVGFWALDETSGTSAADSSGCGNSGTYTGGITNGLMPLIPGGLQGSLITSSKSISFPIVNNYYGSSGYKSLADINSLDNDCSFEVWFYPKFTTTNEAVIFGNSTNLVGLFYDSGDIIFKFAQYTARHSLQHISKSHHIVGTYSPSEIKLYIDGEIKATTSITDLPSLSQTGLTLNSGPTLSASDSFVIDAPAVYRHALPISKIINHYSEIQPIPAHQVAFPDSGRIFEIQDDNISTAYSYSYPGNKPLNYLVTDGIYYNTEEQYISIIQSDLGGSSSIEITDFISIPSGIEANSSKIEWSGSNGISVSVNDQVCTNGGEIPNYSVDSFSSDTGLNIKITLSSSDVSKHIPRLYGLSITFYKDQTVFASNSADYINHFDSDSFTLGSKKYPILSRDSRNGIKAFSNCGFNINTEELISTVEFFYTPSALSNSALISSTSGTGASSNYSWVTAGTISKTNIAAIYVNGVNKTSQTSISNVFIAGEIHHVVIVYTSPVSGALRFNVSASGAVFATYQNIALYPTAFNSTKVSEHYSLYTQRSISIADDSSVTLTENSTSVYNNDWLVIQNI
jgi:hypothetical protein